MVKPPKPIRINELIQSLMNIRRWHGNIHVVFGLPDKAPCAGTPVTDVHLIDENGKAVGWDEKSSVRTYVKLN